MNAIFSFSLYKQGLKRVRAVATAIAVSTITAEIINAVTMKVRHCETCDRDGIRQYIMAEDVMMGSLLLLLLAPVLSYLMFSFLNKRASSDLYHALPFKRTTVYVSYTMALLTWLMGILALNCGASAFGFGVLRGFEVDPWLCIELFFYYASATLLVCGAMLTATMLTGRPLNALFIGALFLYVPVYTMLWFERALGSFYSHFDYVSGLLKYVGTESNVLYKLFDGRASVTSIISSAVFGILWLVLGGIGYARRRSESASFGYTTGKIRVLIWCMIAFVFVLKGACGALFPESFSQREINSYIFIGIAAMLVYLFFSTGQIKAVGKGASWLLAVFTMCVAVIGGARLTAGVMERNTATDPDEIESVAFNVSSIYLDDCNIEYDFSTMEIKDKAVISYSLGNISSPLYYDGYLPSGRNIGVSVTYRLNNGKVITRRTKVDFYHFEGLMQYIINNEEELNRSVYPLPPVSRFETEEQKELWKVFTEEYYNTSFNVRDHLKGNYYSNDTRKFYVYVRNSAGEEVKYHFRAHKEATPEAYKLLGEREK